MQKLHLETASLSLKNIKKIYDWKNEARTLKYSFGNEPTPISAFCENARQKLHALPSLPPQFIVDQGKKIGLVYFEPGIKKNCCEISIFLTHTKQGQQRGIKALEIARELAFNSGIDEIYALIKEENESAQKAFERVGFLMNCKVNLSKYGQKHKALKLVSKNPSVGPKKTFVIAEIGSNFSVGDSITSLEIAKKMIELSAKSGADAVKFQLFKAASTYAPKAGTSRYLNDNIHDVFERFALDPSWLNPLFEHAQYAGVEFMASCFSPREFNLLNPFVKRHKIASYELSHIHLLKLAARSQKPLILSTGCSSIEEIKWAVNTFKKSGGEDLTLMQCTASYPAALNSLHLNCLKTFQKRFNVSVGLSDHSKHPILAPVIAVSLGAKVVEKHVTLCDELIGPDHNFSLNFEEFSQMCQAIRDTEIILGLEKKEIIPQEEELASFAKRGLQALKDIEEGEVLEEGLNFEILRPGVQRLGLHPKYAIEITGKKAAKKIIQGEGVQKKDVVW